MSELVISNKPIPSSQQAVTTSDKKRTSQLSLRNNFEHKESRKAILRSTLVEIEQQIGSIWWNKNLKSKILRFINIFAFFLI